MAKYVRQSKPILDYNQNVQTQYGQTNKFGFADIDVPKENKAPGANSVRRSKYSQESNDLQTKQEFHQRPPSGKSRPLPEAAWRMLQHSLDQTIPRGRPQVKPAPPTASVPALPLVDARCTCKKRQTPSPLPGRETQGSHHAPIRPLQSMAERRLKMYADHKEAVERDLTKFTNTSVNSKKAPSEEARRRVYDRPRHVKDYKPTPGKCCCKRPPQLVMCNMCGFYTKGNIYYACPVCPPSSYLGNVFITCPNCKNPKLLREMPWPQ